MGSWAAACGRVGVSDVGRQLVADGASVVTRKRDFATTKWSTVNCASATRDVASAIAYWRIRKTFRENIIKIIKFMNLILSVLFRTFSTLMFCPMVWTCQKIIVHEKWIDTVISIKIYRVIDISIFFRSKISIYRYSDIRDFWASLFRLHTYLS